MALLLYIPALLVRRRFSLPAARQVARPSSGRRPWYHSHRATILSDGHVWSELATWPLYLDPCRDLNWRACLVRDVTDVETRPVT